MALPTRRRPFEECREGGRGGTERRETGEERRERGEKERGEEGRGGVEGSLQGRGARGEERCGLGVAPWGRGAVLCCTVSYVSLVGGGHYAQCINTDNRFLCRNVFFVSTI